MKKFLFLVLIAGAGLFQVTLLNDLAPWGIKPDLLLAMVILASLFFELKFALFFSIAAGAFKDIFGITPWGQNTFLSALWCLTLQTFFKKVPSDSRLVRTTIFFGVLMVNGIILSSLLGFLRVPAPWGMSVRIIFVESAYTTVFLVLCFEAVSKFIFMPKDKEVGDPVGQDELRDEPDRDGLLY